MIGLDYEVHEEQELIEESGGIDDVVWWVLGGGIAGGLIATLGATAACVANNPDYVHIQDYIATFLLLSRPAGLTGFIIGTPLGYGIYRITHRDQYPD